MSVCMSVKGGACAVFGTISKTNHNRGNVIMFNNWTTTSGSDYIQVVPLKTDLNDAIRKMET